MRILVVEDDVSNQELMIEALELLGHQTGVLSDGRRVAENVENGEYELLVVDCGLPHVSGVDAVAQVRARQIGTDTRRLPIIALTGDVRLDTRNACLASGADVVLTKPLSLDKLESALARLQGPV